MISIKYAEDRYYTWKKLYNNAKDPEIKARHKRNMDRVLKIIENKRKTHNLTPFVDVMKDD